MKNEEDGRQLIVKRCIIRDTNVRYCKEISGIIAMHRHQTSFWFIVNMSLVMRKPAFCICENKDADQLRGNRAKLISAFVFATQIVLSLLYVNPKFQASSHLVWLYSPVCV